LVGSGQVFFLKKNTFASSTSIVSSFNPFLAHYI